MSLWEFWRPIWERQRELAEAARSDWAKFQSSWPQIQLQKLPIYMEICLDFLKSITFNVKNICFTFLATFEEIRLHLILPSGHTGRKIREEKD